MLFKLVQEEKYVEYDIMTPSWGSEKESASKVQEAFMEANEYWGVNDISVTDIENGFHVKINAAQYLGTLYGEVGPEIKERFKNIARAESVNILEEAFDVDVSDFEVKISDEMIEKMKNWVDEIIKKEDEE